MSRTSVVKTVQAKKNTKDLSPWRESRRYAELQQVSRVLLFRGNSKVPLSGTEQVAIGLRIQQILDVRYKRVSAKVDDGVE